MGFSNWGLWRAADTTLGVIQSAQRQRSSNLFQKTSVNPEKAFLVCCLNINRPTDESSLQVANHSNRFERFVELLHFCCETVFVCLQHCVHYFRTVLANVRIHHRQARVQCVLDACRCSHNIWMSPSAGFHVHLSVDTDGECHPARIRYRNICTQQRCLVHRIIVVDVLRIISGYLKSLPVS